MAKAGMLRAEDWRAIIGLAGECRDLGDDATAWRDHLVRRLARMVDADLGSSGETVGHAGGPLRSVGVANWGFDHFTSPKVHGAVFAQVLEDPLCYDLVERWNAEQAREDGAASTRRKLVEDREWYASTGDDLIHRPLGVDHVVACWRTTPGDVRIGTTLFRGRGRRDFDGREVAIVREAHAVLASLVGGPLARFEDPSPRGLPPHMRRVLACLLEGDGDKQVAARLGLSAYSVNQYTKGLYRHFGVRSRAELLARWLRRAYPDPPSWLE
ncbi:MAG: hypothetical protein BGO49_28425 [Planctomycetales bacterium 71-10]|nr:MAG: hypothetical protein BGO49_28425 [Planctomycetales bacterium 71-10]